MTASRYEAWAPVYDHLSRIYSQGGILRAKSLAADIVRPGDRVLIAGSGTGEECIEMAAKGARLTIVDTSPAMLSRCRARLGQQVTEARFICADVTTALKGEEFDLVVAPFFLNVFSVAALPRALATLASLVTKGGHLVSSDFRRPRGGLLFRTLQRLYYLPPLLLFFLAAKNPWHPLYDYPKLAAANKLPLELVRATQVNAWGLALFESLVWEKR